MKNWIRRAGLSSGIDNGNVQFVSLIDATEKPVSVIWLGHASFLLRFGTQTILIDPVFRKWISMVPRRLPVPEAVDVSNIDIVLVSHGHMDHLDERTLWEVNPKKLILPHGTERMLGKRFSKQVMPLQIGETLEYGELKITAVTALHGGWRYPWQRGYFACGYVFEYGDEVIYFAGDSAYGEHFREVGERWEIGTALLPIGAYSPRWFLRSRHMNPEEACWAALDLRAKQVTPYHFGTYRLSLERLGEPMKKWEVAARECGVAWSLDIGLSNPERCF